MRERFSMRRRLAIVLFASAALTGGVVLRSRQTATAHDDRALPSPAGALLPIVHRLRPLPEAPAAARTAAGDAPICAATATRQLDLSGRYRIWFGLLHGHTTASDGRGTVREAFAFARNRSHLDFLAVTDHPEAWGEDGAARWSEAGAEADAATDADFVALRGFEYSHAYWGHFVVLGTEDFRSSLTDFDIGDFYDWLAAPRHAHATAIFAHPGIMWFRRPGEFHHFRYDPRLDDRIVGLETLHWNRDAALKPGFAGRVTYIDEALAKGWHVGSIGSQDNHFADWGEPANRVAVLAPRLTRADILAAVHARHVYATRNSNLRFAFNIRLADGSWATMGDRVHIAALPAARVPVVVRFLDPDRLDETRYLEIVADGQVIARWNAGVSGGIGEVESRASPCSQIHEFSLELPRAWIDEGILTHVYARLVQGRNSDVVTLGSAVFFER